MPLLGTLKHKREAVTTELVAIKVRKEAGLVGGRSVRETLAALRNMRRVGAVAVGVVNSARRFPDHPAIIDARGELTYREVDDRSNAIANAWRAKGLRAGDGIAILTRNHSGLPLAVFAAGKLGCRIMLDTDFAGPQLREVVEREGVDLLVLDEEFTPLLAGTTPPRVGVYRAWAETPGDDTLDALGETGDTSRPPRSDQHARVVVLTSGTTGTPKGAPRTEPRGLASIAALLEEATLGSIEHHPAVAGADRRPSSSNATGKVLKRELRKIGA